MRISAKLKEDSLELVLSGELDESSAEYFRSAMDDTFDRYSFHSVVCDVGGLTFMDSTGIGVLIGRYKKLKGRHIPLYVKNPAGTVDRIFQMSGLYEIMPKIG